MFYQPVYSFKTIIDDLTNWCLDNLYEDDFLIINPIRQKLIRQYLEFL